MSELLSSLFRIRSLLPRELPPAELPLDRSLPILLWLRLELLSLMPLLSQSRLRISSTSVEDRCKLQYVSFGAQLY